MVCITEMRCHPTHTPTQLTLTSSPCPLPPPLSLPLQNNPLSIPFQEAMQDNQDYVTATFDTTVFQLRRDQVRLGVT